MTTLTLDPAAERALLERCAEVSTDPTRIRERFPAAAREVARTPGTSPEPGVDRLEDQVRVRLLAALAGALADDPERLAGELADLYRYGDADERRAVLLGLGEPVLAGVGDRCLDLLRDALRTNDPRLVAAALGPYAADHLDAPAWRQGVLKCLFVGVPLQHVAGLAARADGELRRMVADYAAERRAAGRPVPADADQFLTPTPRTEEP